MNKTIVIREYELSQKEYNDTVGKIEKEKVYLEYKYYSAIITEDKLLVPFYTFSEPYKVLTNNVELPGFTPTKTVEIELSLNKDSFNYIFPETSITFNKNIVAHQLYIDDVNKYFPLHDFWDTDKNLIAFGRPYSLDKVNGFLRQLETENNLVPFIVLVKDAIAPKKGLTIPYLYQLFNIKKTPVRILTYKNLSYLSYNSELFNLLSGDKETKTDLIFNRTSQQKFLSQFVTYKTPKVPEYIKLKRFSLLDFNKIELFIDRDNIQELISSVLDTKYLPTITYPGADYTPSDYGLQLQAALTGWISYIPDNNINPEDIVSLREIDNAYTLDSISQELMFMEHSTSRKESMQKLLKDFYSLSICVIDNLGTVANPEVAFELIAANKPVNIKTFIAEWKSS